MFLHFLRQILQRNSDRSQPSKSDRGSLEAELINQDSGVLVTTSTGQTDASVIIKQYLLRANATPNDPHTLRTLAKLFSLIGSKEEALYYYKLLEIHSQDTLDAFIGQACQYRDLSQYKNAVNICEKALLRGYNSARLCHAHATIFHFAGDLENARIKYLAALELTPDDSNILSDYSRLLCELGELEAAHEHLTQALKLDTKNQIIWLSLGLLYTHFRRYDEAENCYDKGVALNPNSKEARFYRSLFHLLNGNFLEGWKGYESRIHPQNFRSGSLNYPVWRGENIKEKTLLIHGEQGLGDEIMFSSCIPDAIARGPKVVIECNGKLAPILARSFPSTRVVKRIELKSPSWDEIAKTIDYRIPIGSLPNLFRRSSGDFPQHTGYLKSDFAQTEHWRAALRKLGRRLCVGISWRGGTTATRRNSRSTQLLDWLPIFQSPECIFINLQYDSNTAELANFALKHDIPAFTFEEAIADYDKTAALIMALDLVISVQTAVVHLAGALGKRTWVLVPAIPEWRYGIRGERMIWYPEVQLIRSEERQDWTTIFEKTAQRLRSFASDLPNIG